MLSAPTPYPYVGSYALYVDHDGGSSAPAAELVRILNRAWFPLGTVGEDGPGKERTANTLIGFPLRDGASGNRWVAEADLIDPTPLTREEEREHHELDRGLRGTSGRTTKQRAMIARRDALRQRMIWAPMAARLMREAQKRDQRRRAA